MFKMLSLVLMVGFSPVDNLQSIVNNLTIYRVSEQFCETPVDRAHIVAQVDYLKRYGLTNEVIQAMIETNIETFNQMLNDREISGDLACRFIRRLVHRTI